MKLDQNGFRFPGVAARLAALATIAFHGHFNNVQCAHPGLLDPSFDAGQALGLVDRWRHFTLALDPNGKIVVGGAFNEHAGVDGEGVIRLNSDGSVDETFQRGPNEPKNVRSITVQADGKILVTGYFDTFRGQRRIGLARLNVDGSLDPQIGEEVLPNASGQKSSRNRRLPNHRTYGQRQR